MGSKLSGTTIAAVLAASALNGQLRQTSAAEESGLARLRTDAYLGCMERANAIASDRVPGKLQMVADSDVKLSYGSVNGIANVTRYGVPSRNVAFPYLYFDEATQKVERAREIIEIAGMATEGGDSLPVFATYVVGRDKKAHQFEIGATGTALSTWSEYALASAVSKASYSIDYSRGVAINGIVVSVGVKKNSKPFPRTYDERSMKSLKVSHVVTVSGNQYPLVEDGRKFILSRLHRR